MYKRIIGLLVSVFILLGLTACAGENLQPEYNADSQKNVPSDHLIAQNTFFRLEWDSSNMGVVLTELSTGKRWGTSPENSGDVKYDEFGLPIGMHDMVNSVLTVEYHDATAKTDNIIYSYVGVTQNGHINCEKINNGLKVEYYFDTAKFMIPVEYVLFDDHLSITIDPTKIQETDNTVTAVSLAPFWCSAENDTNDSYLFIPSGSGALASVSSVSAQGKSYSAQVYGEDLSIESLYDATDTKDIRLPVYGVKNRDMGTLAIIESGAESAEINITSGSTAYGHSAVYALFQLRGYTVHQSTLFGSKIVNSVIYTDNIITTPLSVSYYPLTGENADYNGMAKLYKSYLTENYSLSSNLEQNRLTVEILGGTMITKSFLGIPYTTLYDTTTVSEANEIVNELSQVVDTGFSVNLKGFGTTGIDIGKLAGGYKIAGKLGSEKELKVFSDICKQRDINLYIDFDLVRFSSGGNGFSTFFDNSTTAGEQKVFKQLYDKAVRDPVEGTEYKLLKPANFEEAASKLSDIAKKWQLSGVSLSTLSSLSYSDYGDRASTKYYAKSDFSNAVTTAVKQIKENGRFAASDANVYAAVLADTLINVPTDSSRDHIFVQDIPFYEMVFSGFVPMSVESLNLSESSEKMLLKAVEAGCGISYTLIGKWDNSLIDADYPYFSNSVYSHLKDDIKSNINRLSEYYDMIFSAQISSHSILENGVRRTEFDNGVVVYVNYSSVAQQTPIGEIAALDYLVLEREA